jgi:hypothetical protein
MTSCGEEVVVVATTKALVRQAPVFGSASSFSFGRPHRFAIFNARTANLQSSPLTRSNPQDEVHVRLSARETMQSLLFAHCVPDNPHRTHLRRPHICTTTIRDLDEDRLTLGTATPRNCSKSPRGSRSPSRPGMSLSRVSLARAQNNFELRLTFCDRSPSKPLTIRIRRSLLTTSRASSQSLSVTWRSASHTYVGFPVAQWKHKLRLLQPKKNVIKIELHHGSRKSVATIRTVRTLIVCCDPRYGGDVSGNTGKG